MTSILQYSVYGLYLMTLGYAAVSDARTYRIPNTVFLTVVAIVVLAGVLAYPEFSPLEHLGVGAATFVVGFVLVQFGIFGGGDVKLWSAAAAWQGVDWFPVQLVSVAIIGGALGIVLVLLRKILSKMQGSDKESQLPRVFRSGEAVPYGIAIAAGSALVAHLSPLVDVLDIGN